MRFIVSINWTEQGIRTIKDWPKRMGAARELAKKVGVEIKEVYLTSGDHDLVYLSNKRGGNGGSAHLWWYAPDTFYNFQVVPRSAVMEAPQSTELPEQKVPVSKEIPDR